MTGKQITELLKSGAPALDITAQGGLVLKLGKSDQLCGEVLEFCCDLLQEKPDLTIGEMLDALDMARWWIVLLGAIRESPSHEPELRTVDAAAQKIVEERDALKQLVAQMAWEAQASYNANVALQAERDLWQRRAETQMKITRAAVDVVAKPFQIYDGTIGMSGYRISRQEFEAMQAAVETYKKLSEQEHAQEQDAAQDGTASSL